MNEVKENTLEELLDTFYSYHDSKGETESKLGDLICKLLDALEKELAGKYGNEIIEEGYGYLDDPDNKLSHISKDLWKGFVHGYFKGHLDARERYEDENDEE